VNDNVQFSAFTKRELGKLAKTFQTMGDEAVEESRKVAYDISLLAQSEIKSAGYSRTKANKAVRRVVDGASVSRSSKTGRLSYGFANQRLSGGGSTRTLWQGLGIRIKEDSNNFQLGQGERQGAAQMATSSFQPFAKFSLN
jgi:hypothetical protein